MGLHTPPLLFFEQQDLLVTLVKLMYNDSQIL